MKTTTWMVLGGLATMAAACAVTPSDGEATGKTEQAGARAGGDGQQCIQAMSVSLAEYELVQSWVTSNANGYPCIQAGNAGYFQRIEAAPTAASPFTSASIIETQECKTLHVDYFKVFTDTACLVSEFNQTAAKQVYEWATAHSPNLFPNVGLNVCGGMGGCAFPGDPAYTYSLSGSNGSYSCVAAINYSGDCPAQGNGVTWDNVNGTNCHAKGMPGQCSTLPKICNSIGKCVTQ